MDDSDAVPQGLNEPEYLDMLINFHTLQKTLMHSIEGLLEFNAAAVAGHTFVPLYPSIKENIQNWPENTWLLPLGAWISPRCGTIQLSDDSWDYMLHGTQQITFIHQSTRHNVSITLSACGEIGFAAWDVYLYTTTSQPTSATFAETAHAAMLMKFVEQDKLDIVPAKPLFDEKVFIFQSR